MKIIVLATFPPRQCGIATFTENLIRAIETAANQCSEVIDIEVIGMNDSCNTYSYPFIVKRTIHSTLLDDYIRTADYINESGADLFLLQHEYGIYGGESGVFVLALLRRLKVPVVSTFHTVLLNPSFHQHQVLMKIAAYSAKVVVMSKLAIDFLAGYYHVRRGKIIQVEHGVPDFELLKKELLPTPKSWDGRIIMLTFGLIGRSKGIETALRALPSIIGHHPEVLYVILGKTHPNILCHAGEEYRESLQKLVTSLKLDNHVLFIDEYTEELQLMSYLKRAEIYVTPYLNKAQITSGTLSYAVSGGCAVISTPYWHAEELLSNGLGRLFDFGNYEQLATIVNDLLDDPELLKKIQQSALDYGKGVTWTRIGKAYLDVFKQILQLDEASLLLLKEDLLIQYPTFDLAHLKRLTDNTGLLQHARTSVPCYKAGYCLDDNSRAIVVIVAAWQRFRDPSYIELIYRYLAYSTYMQQKDGSFKNYMTFDHQVLDDTSDDTYGRMIWALGYLIRYAPDNSSFQLGLELFVGSISLLGELQYIRGYANCILGLYHYIKRFPDQEKYIKLLEQLTDKLCEKFILEQKSGWNWFEDSLTYDNGLLPAALYRAYEITNSNRYLTIADESRMFLESKCFREEWLSLIGNRKWLRLDQDYEIFAQQPVDALAMVLLYESAWEATGKKEFADKIVLSYNWFIGENDFNISLFDENSKGCFDGIEHSNINLNQGAESNISFLLASLIAQPFINQSSVDID